MQPSRRALAVLAGAFALVAIVSATALAGRAVKTKSSTQTVAGGDQASVTPSCKPGTKAVSGGFAAEYDPDNPIGPFFISSESRRTGARGWTSTALNLFAFGDPGDLTSFAYCRDERVKVTSETTSIGQDEFGSVTAKCKRGQQVLSGGSEAEVGAVRVTASRKLGKRKWLVEGFNDGSGDGSLTADAYCHAGKAPKTSQAEETLSGGLEFGSAEASCRRKQRVVSGGFDVEGAGDDVAETLIMGSQKLGRRGWEVAGLDNGGGEVTLLAYAYCEKKRPG